MAKVTRKTTQTRKSTRPMSRAGGISQAQRKKTRLQVEKMNKSATQNSAFNVSELNDAMHKEKEEKARLASEALRGAKVLETKEILQGQKKDKRIIEELDKQEQEAASSLEDQIARMTGFSL